MPREEMTNKPSPPLIDLREVARLEEGRLARGYSEVTPEHKLIGAASLEAGTAVAGRAEPGSWLNSVVNLGMRGPVTRADIDAIIDWYASKSIEPTIELCPFADPSVTEHASAAGFAISPGEEIPGIPRGFDNVFYRVIGASERVTACVPTPAGLAVQVIHPDDESRVREFVELAVRRSSPTAPPATDNERATVRRCIEHPRTKSMAALLDGRIIGVGLVDLVRPGQFGNSDQATDKPGIAALFSAKVDPGFRRRGVQQALIAARLNLANQEGIKIATIGSRPGLATERNVRRMGFQLAYTKVILVRPGKGLRRIGE